MNRVKFLRERNCKTQEELAVYLNMSQATYSRIENNIHRLSEEVIIKLVNYYNVSSDYILGLTNKKERI